MPFRRRLGLPEWGLFRVEMGTVGYGLLGIDYWGQLRVAFSVNPNTE